MKMNKAVLFIVLSVFFVLGSATVKAQSKTDRQKVEADAKHLIIPACYTQNLHWDLPLDSVGKN